MKGKLGKAILNNTDLYESIFKSHGIELHKTNSIFYSLEKAPPLYSNIVTLSKDWRPDEVFKEINSRFEKENWNSWAIKDSFGVLELKNLGFTRIVSASWIYLEHESFTPKPGSKDLEYKIIRTEEELSEWKRRWGRDEILESEIFNSQLLNDLKILFIAGYEKEEIITGCVINKSEEVLGISNFFAPEDKVEYWNNMIKFVFDSIGERDIVGYEKEKTIQNLKTLGFEDVGKLTVWLKKD